MHKDKEEIAKAIAMRVAGKTYGEIAKETNYTRMTVWNNLNKAEVKAEVERLQREFLATNVERSMDKMKEIIHADYDPKIVVDEDGNPIKDNSGRPVVMQDEVGRKLQYRAIERTLETASILPSQTTSVYINQLNQVNLFQTPEAQLVMKKFAGYLTGNKEDVVDASEIEESTTVNGNSPK